MDWKKLGKQLLDMIDWKAMLGMAYKEVRPLIAKKVNESSSKWDDWAFEMVDRLILKFVDEHLLDAEKSREDLIAENK